MILHEASGPLVPAWNPVLLVRIGEISLKGQNRGSFEIQLARTLQRRLESLGGCRVVRSQSRIYVEPEDSGFDMEEAADRATRIFGVVSVSPAVSFLADPDGILAAASSYMGHLLEEGTVRTFKVEARRGDKRFPMDSPALCREVGARVLDDHPGLAVDVHRPDVVLYLEIRERIYLYHRILRGQRGLPVGMSGKGMLLLSGGIDSPVAGYLMASRGMVLEMVYFHSHPYTSERARDKVVDLAGRLSEYCGRSRLWVVDFTPIQLALRDHGPADMLTILMRRMMMRIAERLSGSTGCKALITGESLGQVASQTLEAICVTDAVVRMPVFRPLVGLDKEEAVTIARRIGTFETSILPYEDCCTLFTAPHPRTRPTLRHAEDCEEGLPIGDMVEEACRTAVQVRIGGPA